MRKLFFVPLLLMHALGFAQTIEGDFDLTSYPEVSFVWNEYNPEVKDSSQFVLTANGERIPYQLQHLPPKNALAQASTILFLWEDLDHASHRGQSEFIQTVLLDFLKDSVGNRDDRFNVAVFDRKGGNDLGSSIHTLLSDGFTSDREQLAVAVKNFRPKYDFFSKQENSELYMAIEEGIEWLRKEPSDRVRAIVVFTAGSNLDNYGGRNSIDESRALALKIPVYVVKYPIRGCEHCSNIDVVCRKTYGLEVATGDAAVASELLKKGYAGMGRRHHGQDYRVTFTSGYPRDGQQHALVLNVGGEKYPLSFAAPAFSLLEWMKGHVVLAILLGLGLALIITFAGWMICRNRKEKQRKLIALQEEIETNRQALQDYRTQKDGEEQFAEAQKREEHLQNLMQAKNLFPRLQYTLNEKNECYIIGKPKTSIGRDGANDLVLASDSVSRRHAQILFNGAAFEILDLGSTNRVIVNGAFVERATLANGDIIGLGEVVVYFNA
jgi:hypothetical protein